MFFQVVTELLSHSETGDVSTAEQEDESQQEEPVGDTAKCDSGIQVCPELKNVHTQTSTRTKSVGE